MWEQACIRTAGRPGGGGGWLTGVRDALIFYFIMSSVSKEKDIICDQPDVAAHLMATGVTNEQEFLILRHRTFKLRYLYLKSHMTSEHLATSPGKKKKVYSKEGCKMCRNPADFCWLLSWYHLSLTTLTWSLSRQRVWKCEMQSLSENFLMCPIQTLPKLSSHIFISPFDACNLEGNQCANNYRKLMKSVFSFRLQKINQ